MFSIRGSRTVGLLFQWFFNCKLFMKKQRKNKEKGKKRADKQNVLFQSGSSFRSCGRCLTASSIKLLACLISPQVFYAKEFYLPNRFVPTKQLTLTHASCLTSLFRLSVFFSASTSDNFRRYAAWGSDLLGVKKQKRVSYDFLSLVFLFRSFHSSRSKQRNTK